MIKRIKNFLSKEEWNFDAFISSIILFIGIMIDTNWEENILSIVLTILGGIFASCILYVILAVTFSISNEHIPLKGFVSGFIICFMLFGTYNIYNIGQEQEEITATIDRNVYINSDYLGVDYENDAIDYISGKNNYFDLKDFVESVFMNMEDNEIACKVSNKLILNEGKYYKVCDNSILFEPNENDVILNTK